MMSIAGIVTMAVVLKTMFWYVTREGKEKYISWALIFQGHRNVVKCYYVNGGSNFKSVDLIVKCCLSNEDC